MVSPAVARIDPDGLLALPCGLAEPPSAVSAAARFPLYAGFSGEACMARSYIAIVFTIFPVGHMFPLGKNPLPFPLPIPSKLDDGDEVVAVGKLALVEPKLPPA